MLAMTMGEGEVLGDLTLTLQELFRMRSRDDSTQNGDDGKAAKEKEGFPQSRDDPNKEVDFLVIHQDFSLVQWTECVFGSEVLPPPKRGKN